MAGVDLFTWLDALWNKQTPEGTPPIFLMHRFLASDQVLAPACRELQREFKREPHLTFHVWKGLLPKGRGAPRLAYVVAKKPPAAEELTERMMAHLGERRYVVEEIQSILKQAGRLDALYEEYGIMPPKDVA